MSAFIVSSSTIEAIVTFARRHLDSIEPLPGASTATLVPIDAVSTHAIGQALLDENHRSVNHRYATHDLAPRYRHLDRVSCKVDGSYWRLLMAVDMIKLCHCLAYQSCEHDDWETSWVRRFLDRVIDAAVRLLPDYDDTPWGLYDDDTPPCTCDLTASSN
jgi:hypothetical protein